MIRISGVIGWDVVGVRFAEMFSRLSGDVDIEIDSPGGFVFDGIAIYNAIKNYSKGKVNIHVAGIACSMAAYIMLAGDSLSFEPNALVMVHNPLNTATGDYRTMKENASFLERLAALYSSAFVEKGLFSEKEIRDAMDAETWFIGKTELAKLGTVKETTITDPAQAEPEITIAAAKERFSVCQAKLREQDVRPDEISRIAALLPTVKTPEANAVSVPTSKINLVVQEKEGEKIMKLDELKAQHPDVYAQAVKIGVEQEQKRTKALLNFIDVDKETAVKAIQEGTPFADEELQSKFLLARINGRTVAEMEENNPPEVNPKEPAHAPEGEGGEGGEGEELTPEEKEKAAADAEAKQLEKVLGYMNLK